MHIVVNETVDNEQTVLLVGEFTNVIQHRAQLVALLVALRQVHVALCVARVVEIPRRHWSTRNYQLQKL